MNGKKAKLLRKLSGFNPTIKRGIKDYTVDTVLVEGVRRKLDGKLEIVQTPVYVLSLNDNHPRKLYKRLKKEFGKAA